MMNTLTCIIIAVLAVLWLWGCEGDRANQTAAPAGSVTAEAKNAFYIKEADLPEGFPPPNQPKEVVLKYYPAARMARVSQGPDQSNSQNAMFSPLFNHIKKKDIPMTAPVEMVYAEPDTEDMPTERESMAFYYTSTEQGQTGPDDKVEVIDVDPMWVLSVGVRGSYNEKTYQPGFELIYQHLAEHPDKYRIAGPPRVLAYNSPMILWFLRYSEVQIPVILPQ